MTASPKTSVPKNVDEYISSFPTDIAKKLMQIRKIIKAAAPKAEEGISYRIAGYKYHGMLIFFAAFKNHISVYPAPRETEAFKKELAVYKSGKGTIQFPLDKPIPLNLVSNIVKFRVKENEAKAAAKQTAKMK
jgi:uncharacterized protein YdhG (YjbR/CyaY superfamily)